MAKKKSFWSTLPGILAGLAAVITATAGLVALLVRDAPPPQPTPRPPEGDSRPTPTPPAPTAAPTAEPSPVQPSGFRVVEAFLRVDPFDYNGPCPVTLRFGGRISAVGGSGTVAYRFVRSDGASAPVRTVTFDAPGSKDVESTWRRGASGSEFRGWKALEILDPREMESARAEFHVRCE